MKKTLCLLLVALTLFMTITGCGAGPAPKAKEISVSFGPEPSSIDPQISAASDSANYLIHLFEGLMTYDKQGKLQNAQASGCEVSDDGRTYTFTLRGTTWSDGSPVTASDFVYAWQRLLDPELACEYSFLLDGIVKNATQILEGTLMPSDLGVLAPDERTFIVELETPCAYFLDLCTLPNLYPVKQAVVEKDPEGWTLAAESYVSNGPYSFVQWQHDKEIVTQKNKSYWNLEGVTGPDVLRFVLEPDPEKLLSSYHKNEIALSRHFPREKTEDLLSTGEVVIYSLLGVRFLCFNFDVEPLSDARVRQALTLAIDRNALANEVMGGGEKPASALVPYEIVGPQGEDFRVKGGDFFSLDPEAYEKNCEQARALLAEAGYPGGRGFPTLTFTTDDAPTNVKTAEAMVEMFKRELGITLSIHKDNWAEYLQDTAERKYEICRADWIGDYHDPTTFLDLFISNSELNLPGYRNSRYDSLISQAKFETDTERRCELLSEAEKLIVATDWAVAPYTFTTEPMLQSPKLKGMIHNPLGFIYLMWAYLEK